MILNFLQLHFLLVITLSVKTSDMYKSKLLSVKTSDMTKSKRNLKYLLVQNSS